MVALHSFVTLALAAFVAASTSPSRTTRSTQDLAFNPPKAVNPIPSASPSPEVEVLTNAKRFEHGMGPLPPVLHKRGHRDPRHHPVPSPRPPREHCGKFAVLDKNQKTIGYVDKHPNAFGEYVVTHTKADALCICYKPNGLKPVDVRIDNGPLATRHHFGAIQGYSDNDGNLRNGAFEYAFLGGVYKTPAYAKPYFTGNSFSDATEVHEVSQSSIWVIDPVSHRAVPHYVNPNGSKPTVKIVLEQTILALTGDAAVFSDTFGTAQTVTFKFLGN